MDNQQLTRQEKRAIYNTIYRIEYSEEISARRKEKCVCVCGKEICKRFLSDHIKSKPHQLFLQQQRLEGTEANETTLESEQTTPKEKRSIYMMKYNPKYREQHKEAITEQRMTYMQKKVVCSCGMEVIRNNMTQHIKTKKTLTATRGEKALSNGPN